MKKNLFVTFLIVINQISAFAYELKTDTVTIEKGDSQINQVIVSIINSECENLWIWFGEPNNDRDDAYEIKMHLMKREADFSLFDIATDANMEGCLWCMPMSMRLFVKCIEPGNSFKVVIYKESRVGEGGYISSIDFNRHIRIYKNEDVVRFCPGIDSKLGIKRISYPYDVIILNEHMIYF